MQSPGFIQGVKERLALYLTESYNFSMTLAKYKSNNNIVYSCKYHVVWCTKYRRDVLDERVQDELKMLISEICTKRKSEILALELMPDHVHLLVEVDPQYGIHRLIKEIKGNSSHFLRKKYKHLCTRLPTLWTNSYFVSTFGGAPISIVKQYVEAQKFV
jgi:putative transposase